MTQPAIVGFSGGGDSLALLHRLAARGPCVAAIVDHGLRPESAAEAGRAADIARDLGAKAEIITLSWPEGRSVGQAAARIRRHQALAGFAKRNGGGAVHLGHTLDDQAETLLMRLAHGSGPAGLAGMAAAAPSPVWPAGRGIVVRRPLLGARRAALRDELRLAKLAWIDDPSNEMVRYERVRVRAALARREAQGFDAARLAGLAARAARLAGRRAAAAKACLAAAFTLSTDGTGRLARPAFLDFPPPTRGRALAALLTALSGRERMTSAAAACRLAARIAEGGKIGGCLGGARFSAADDGDVRFARDPGAVLGRGGATAQIHRLTEGESEIWDGRLEILRRAPGWVLAARGRGSDPAAPVLTSRGASLPLASAESEGLIVSKWLIQERLDVLLWRARTA